MNARRFVPLTIGLVAHILLLGGCATTVSDDMGRQLGGLRADVQRLTAEVTQLRRTDSRLQAELPHLWEELLATNDLLVKVVERLHDVERQAHAASQAPLATQRALESLRQRTQVIERRLHAFGNGGSEARVEPRAEPAPPPPPSTPVTTKPERPELKRGMSEAEVLARLGEPTRMEQTTEIIFWIYSDGQHVSFDRATGQVRGWLWW